MDYVHLRDFLNGLVEKPEMLTLSAHVVTPVDSLDAANRISEDYVDARFVQLLSRLGYRVARSFCVRSVQETADGRIVSMEKTSVAKAIYVEVMAAFEPAIEVVGRVILVSGAGSLLPTAQAVKTIGRELWVVAFTRAGDVHSGFYGLADRIVSLDGSFRWSTSRKKLAKMS